jgi:hypothetical protein
VPAVPIWEWKIKTWDQLPEHLKFLLQTLPPYLTTRRAADLRGGGRTKLYEEARKGVINAYRDNGSTLWETLSILLVLANLPPAPIRVDPSKAPASSDAPPRRGRGRPHKATSTPASVPPLAPPAQQVPAAEVMPSPAAE